MKPKTEPPVQSESRFVLADEHEPQDVIPQPNTDQKLAIRDVQVAVLKARAESRKHLDHAENLEEGLILHIEALAQSLGLFGRDVSFSQDTLQFYKSE